MIWAWLVLAVHSSHAPPDSNTVQSNARTLIGQLKTFSLTHAHSAKCAELDFPKPGLPLLWLCPVLYVTYING